MMFVSMSCQGGARCEEKLSFIVVASHCCFLIILPAK